MLLWPNEIREQWSIEEHYHRAGYLEMPVLDVTRVGADERAGKYESIVAPQKPF